MGFVGIGAGLALLLTLLALRANARHDRAVRLIHQTAVRSIADVVQSAHADPSSPTHAAVQGRVVSRETTRLTAPITGDACVAYKVRVYWPDDEAVDENYIVDSKWVPWAVDDGTGLAPAPFNPLDLPKALTYPHPYYWPEQEFSWSPLSISKPLSISEPLSIPELPRQGRPYCWPGQEYSGDTFKNGVPHSSLPILSRQERQEPSSSPLDRVLSHYGPERLPSPGGWLSPSYEDLSWEVSILKEFGKEVFLLGPCTVQEGCAHFQLGDAAWIWKFIPAATDSLLWFGSREDALSDEQRSAKHSARWAEIWLTVFVILTTAYLYVR